MAYDNFIPVVVGILYLSLLNDNDVSLNPCWIQDGAHIPTIGKSLNFCNASRVANL
jgi:hypothetical protein